MALADRPPVCQGVSVRTFVSARLLGAIEQVFDANCRERGFADRDRTCVRRGWLRFGDGGLGRDWTPVGCYCGVRTVGTLWCLLLSPEVCPVCCLTIWTVGFLKKGGLQFFCLGVFGFWYFLCPVYHVYLCVGQ